MKKKYRQPAIYMRSIGVQPCMLASRQTPGNIIKSSLKHHSKDGTGVELGVGRLFKWDSIIRDFTDVRSASEHKPSKTQRFLQTHVHTQFSIQRTKRHNHSSGTPSNQPQAGERCGLGCWWDGLWRALRIGWRSLGRSPSVPGPEIPHLRGASTDLGLLKNQEAACLVYSGCCYKHIVTTLE